MPYPLAACRPKGGAAPAPPSPLLTDLISYWKLDEQSGTREDAHGANDLDDHSVGYALGKVDNAADLAAASKHYFSHADNAGLSAGDVDFTVALWVYFDLLTDTRVLVAKGDAQTVQGLEYLLETVGTTLLVTVGNNVTFGQATWGSALDTGAWYFIVFWHDSVNNKVGLQVDNGVPVLANYSGGGYDSAQIFTLGRRASNDEHYLDGRLDEVGFWKRLLTADERTTLWNGGSGISYPFDVSPNQERLVVSNPGPYQVNQRDGSGQADIVVAGEYQGNPTGVEARWNGSEWVAMTVVSQPGTGRFTGTLADQAAGQGLFEVRFTDKTSVSLSRTVGIGDVFVVAGQSNAVGCATNNQVYSHATLKAGMFGNDYQWKELADPLDDNTGQVDSVSSDSASGSLWPLLATSIMAHEGVPVAFIPCARGGSTIAVWQPDEDHQLRSTLYGSMVYRALNCNCAGVKAVLWWQGEGDVGPITTQAGYNALLDTLANTIATDLACKLMACKLLHCSGVGDAELAVVQAAIAEAWGDNANVLTGPDLSDLASDDDYHYQTDALTSTVAGRWWAALHVALYGG